MKNVSLFLLVVFMTLATSVFADPPTAPTGFRWEKIENMSDEFTGNSLNLSKWAKSDPQWSGRVPGKFKPNTISVNGGYLKITNYKLSSPEGAYTHGCGLVRSLNKGLYGYYESRMKASKTFLSSTFWLFNKRNEFNGCDVRTTELDITETVGVNSNGANWVNNMVTRMNANTHSRGTTCPSTPVGIQGGHASLGEESWRNFHTYAVWWKSKTDLRFYLDDEYKFSITPPADFNLPMYLRMVTETYDWNPVPNDGGMTGSADSRTTYYDWTRTWKLVPDNTPVVQAAYPDGVPHAIPGTIEAENFDTGGQGVAYNDNDANNAGPNVMRENEGVDIESRDGGNNVGWINDGEWLEYTVNATSGNYDIQARVATSAAGKSIVVKLDGSTIGTFTVPNTGGWGSFQTITLNNIPVTGGNNKILRLEFVGTGININWVKFNTANVPATGVNVTPSDVALQVGASRELAANVTPANATDKTVTWSSSNTAVATINANGLVSAIAEGDATITATTANGLTSTSTVTVTANTNQVQNFDFETGDLTSWIGFGTRQVVTDAAGGNYAVKVTGTGGNAQVITVQPNTQYTLSANVKAQSGSSVILGVKNYGGSEKGNSITATSYTPSSLTFTTGSNNTTARIYLYVANAGQVGFGDDFVVTITPPQARTNGFSSNSPVLVYPNPVRAGETFSLDLSSHEDEADIRILDATGRVIYHRTTRDSKFDVQTSELSSKAKGVYFITISSKNARSSVRFVIQ